MPGEILVRYLEKVFYLEGDWALLQVPHGRGHSTKPDMFSSIWTTLSGSLSDSWNFSVQDYQPDFADPWEFQNQNIL